MIREVDDCKGCGLCPCYHCTREEAVCDECEADEMYSYYPFEDKQLCQECFIALACEVGHGDCPCGREGVTTYKYGDEVYCDECITELEVEL